MILITKVIVSYDPEIVPGTFLFFWVNLTALSPDQIMFAFTRILFCSEQFDRKILKSRVLMNNY